MGEPCDPAMMQGNEERYADAEGHAEVERGGGVQAAMFTWAVPKT